MNVEIREKPGTCRWCGCTYERACAGGCGWANTKQTLCTACVTIDRMFKSVRERRELVQRIQEELNL